MHVAHLTLHDFRSYADIDVVLEPGVTALPCELVARASTTLGL